MKISVGYSRKARKWKNTEIEWSNLITKLSTTIRTPETVAEYAKSKNKSDIKDKGGFVGGWLKNGVRSSQTVLYRTMLTLDADKVAPDFLKDYLFSSKCESLVYTTHGHTPTNPRLRILVPLTRSVSAEEYNALARLYASQWGIENFDPCSFSPAQMMFWPSTPLDGEYICETVRRPWLDPDTVLTPDWQDPTKLPRSAREPEPHEKKLLEDPLTKAGLVGTFCRAVGNVQNAIEQYLGDVYERVTDTRYKYIPASSAAGVLLFEDKWAYSCHATDPAAYQNLNAYDLVRIHKFPDDEDKMKEWVASLPEVNKALLKERQEAAGKEFTEEDWQDALVRDKKGELVDSIPNLGLILAHDKNLQGIVYNELSEGIEIINEVPWSHPWKFWRDLDDAQLVWYIEHSYGTFGKRTYKIAFDKLVDDRRYHPIKNYLEGLAPWDGYKRVDTLLVDYLGAEDTPYVRAVTRKILCAAVRRVYHPGTKFDNLVVLIGKQGIGKSTLIAILAKDWFSDSLTLSDIGDGKAGAEKLQGVWIMEISEMAGMKKADQEKLKAFISRQDDRYRAAYGERVQSHPRQAVLFGTTNAEEGFLRDVSGNRRYWPVEVSGQGRLRLWSMTQDDVDQIWAEVLTMADSEELTLDASLAEEALAAQNAAVEEDERVGFVQQYLDTLLPKKWEDMDIYQRREFLNGDEILLGAGTVKRDTVSNIEIWCECFGKAKEDFRPTDGWAIRSIMMKIEGWRRTKRYERSKQYGRQRVYERV